MVEPRKKHLINSCVVIAGLLTIVPNRSLYAALPPVSAGAQSQEGETKASSLSDNQSEKSVPRAATSERETIFALPPVRFGGKVSYELRSDASDDQKIVQQGITSTLTARTNTYLWQPWFATVSGDLGVSVLRYSTINTYAGSSFAGNGNSVESLTSKNLVTTGNLQLNVIPRSKYPFEAHFSKSDSRINGTLSALSGYSTMNYGLSQNFDSPIGSGQLGLDRSQQISAGGGETQQDSLRLSLAKSLTGYQTVQLNGTHSKNTLKNSGETATQSNLSLQHKFSPSPALTFDSVANLSKAGYRLAQGNQDTDLMQLSSFGFWRPSEGPLMITGGVRLLTLANSANNVQMANTGTGNASRMQNANVNFGANYDYSRAVRLSASANFNTASGFGQRNVDSSQSVGATYQPESKKLGQYRYDWSASTSFNNASSSSGTQRQQRHLSLQLSHSLGRSYQLGTGTAVAVNGGQSLSSLVRSAGGPTQHLTHTGSVSWNRSSPQGSTYVSLSGSDSRSMGDQDESFQMVNFQASSSIPTGRYSSWSGNLTIQAVNQHSSASAQNQGQFNGTNRGAVTTSTGSLSYQNQRVFGVPRLRFLSDIRLNSEALLPILGGPQDQEKAAWENNLDYEIGRTQFRMSARVAQVGGRNNKSIMFSATRGLGD